MKKFKKVFASAVFLAIGLALTIMTSYVMRPLVENFHRDEFAGFYAEKKNTLDVVGLGSSALYCFLNSPVMYEHTGITSYPLATAGQQFYVVEHLIDEILKTQSPQLLIVETRRFLSSSTKVKMNRLHMVTDNMNYSLNRVSLINKLVDGWGKRLPFYFDIMSYHENWENLSTDSFTYLFNSRPNQLKGWNYYVKHVTLEKPDIGDVTEELPLMEESEDALRGILEKCREENLEVLFLLSPYKINSKAEKRANYMKRIIEEYGFRFLDCNRCTDEIGLDFQMDFYDKKHVNAIGADKFSRFLGEYIQENYDIDTEHSPEVTADWDEAVEKNHSLYQKAKEEIFRNAREERENADAQQR